MIHVLYVDDEPDLLVLGKTFLEKAGDTVVDTASSAHQALDMLAHMPYDAIVSDYQMPEMDGISFLKHVRAMPSEIPVILFTGKGREEIVIEALNNGADFYVQKGGDPRSQFIELHHKIIQSVKRRESEEKFRILVEKSLVGVYIIQDDRFIHVNPRFADIFGYTQDEIIHHLKVADLVLPEDRDIVAVNLQLRFSNKESSLHYTFRGMHKNRQSMMVEVIGTRALFHGQPIVVGTLIDVSRHTIADPGLARTNRKLSLLNSLTRHDIANRLTVLRGRLKIIRNQYRDPGLMHQIAKIEEAARDIYTHLETARAYQNIGMDAPRWFNLQETISRELEHQTIPRLTTTLKVADLEILADPLFNRVFTNLIDNTVRHGDHATEVSVAYRKDSRGMVVLYEDNGQGVPDDFKTQIFEQGFGKNTGLGLYLCREILASTGITIAETGTYGNGARFELNVPSHAWQFTRNPADLPGASPLETQGTHS